MNTEGARYKVRTGIAAAQGRVTDYSNRWRYGITNPPPRWADLTGYEPLLAVIARNDLAQRPGDVLEIGPFLGGGTAKLCGLFAKRAPAKRVIAVDIFDPDFDHTTATDGNEMAKHYAARLEVAGGLNQRGIFDDVTRGYANLVVVAGDSTSVNIPTDTLCFGMIDGHHAPDYVRADFETVWSRLTPGGVVAMHDYGHDLPQVTHTINALIGEHAAEIARMWTVGIIAFVQKEP